MKMSEKSEVERKKCLCVYCHEEMVEEHSPFCKPCSVTLLYCKKCEVAVPRDSQACPHCGGVLDWR